MSTDVLFEIGVEELPARFIDQAERELKERTTSWFKDMRIPFSELVTFSTPRRLAILIRNVSDQQETIEEEVRGPALSIAKDAAGNWTKAAIGFTRGQGKTTDDIYTKDIKETTYIFINKRTEGQQTIDILPSFKDIILSIPFNQTMRWGQESIRYARPIRWLVALYGDEVIPFEIAQIKTDCITKGHRFLGRDIHISEPKQYETLLQKEFVIVDAKKRETLILEGIKEIEEKENVQIPVDTNLLNEVRNLVEYPTVFMGDFEEEFLQLPEEVLIISMKEHQRYFPVKSTEGQLLPHFIGVRNGDQYALDTVIKGNEKVLRARLADARFFYDEDQNVDINDYQEKLKSVIFQEKLGTLHDKVQRVKQITKEITERLNLDKSLSDKAVHAASLSKFDLMTNMVNEFTELQGVMGEKYALLKGETPEVAKAIREHYMPLHAQGDLPNTDIGSIVSIADKLDTIVGCIHVGLKPTGSQDPYGLRRQAIGILRIMDKGKWHLSVEELVQIAVELYMNQHIPGMEAEELAEAVLTFVNHRIEYLFKQQSIESDVIKAVIDQEIGILTYAKDKARLLSAKRNDESFKTNQEALVRVLNLSEKAERVEIDEEVFITTSEKALYQAYLETKETYLKAEKADNAEQALNALSKLSQPIHEFFEDNMVMAKEDDVRHNRLALLYSISTLIRSFANLQLIEWKQHF
ncbi:MAG TPA: glycine--tRNA ligase subunit beta [Cerasibacillus sp.]|uniref:glycine--tRNA ligase subunit beta n=1 Tax=Cerasibacillus sp. TaxID=2498711 RepID=UPI002F3FA219